jgi:hypothetical protein
MIAEIPAVPLVPDFIAHLELRLKREFGAAVEDWGRAVTALSYWEDEHLLDESPRPELLARHKQTVERLLRFGQFLAVSAGEPEFTNDLYAENIKATIRCLSDKLLIWHAPDIGEARRKEILSVCFNES